jgi:hypothetical protein
VEATITEQQTDWRGVSMAGAARAVTRQLQHNFRAPLHNSLEGSMAPLNMPIKQAKEMRAIQQEFRHDLAMQKARRNLKQSFNGAPDR